MCSHMVQDVCLFVFFFPACFPFFHDFPIWSNGFPMFFPCFFPMFFTMKPFGMKVTVAAATRQCGGRCLAASPGSHHNYDELHQIPQNYGTYGSYKPN